MKIAGSQSTYYWYFSNAKISNEFCRTIFQVSVYYFIEFSTNFKTKSIPNIDYNQPWKHSQTVH